MRLKYGYYLGGGLFALAVLSGILLLALPSIMGILSPKMASDCSGGYVQGNSLRGSLCDTQNQVKNLLGVAMFLELIGSVLLLPLVALIEIFTSKNQGNWKVLWGAVVFLFGILGVAAFIFLGRKEMIN